MLQGILGLYGPLSHQCINPNFHVKVSPNLFFLWSCVLQTDEASESETFSTRSAPTPAQPVKANRSSQQGTSSAAHRDISSSKPITSAGATQNEDIDAILADLDRESEKESNVQSERVARESMAAPSALSGLLAVNKKHLDAGEEMRNILGTSEALLERQLLREEGEQRVRPGTGHRVSFVLSCNAFTSFWFIRLREEGEQRARPGTGHRVSFVLSCNAFTSFWFIRLREVNPILTLIRFGLPWANRVYGIWLCTPLAVIAGNDSKHHSTCDPLRTHRIFWHAKSCPRACPTKLVLAAFEQLA
jgi:hypothetical protein